MDLKSRLFEVFVLVILFKDANVNATLSVTDVGFTATGTNLGLSIQVEFSGVADMTCIIDADDDDEIISTTIVETTTPPIEATFTTSGFFDIALSCFGEDELITTIKENFYVGDEITGIDVSNNSTGLAIPFDITQDQDLPFEVSFLTGTDVNITFELLHTEWEYQNTSLGNGTYYITLPKSYFSTAGLYTLNTTFVNPLEPSGISKYAVLAVQEPLAVTTVVLKQYTSSSGNPTYVMLGQELEVEISLTAGDDLTFSLTVSTESGDNCTVIAMKGSACTGKTTLHSLMYTFNASGEYNITVEITNYVSRYSEVISVQVIYEVNVFSGGEVSPLILPYSDSATFTVTVSDTANLPMGTVSCDIDYDDGSSLETNTFDMTPSEFGSLSATTDSFSHDYVARWYATRITCKNQLPELVNSVPTTMVFDRMVKVQNPVENLMLTYDSATPDEHPFSKPITFTIRLENPGTDLPLANLTCDFYIANGEIVDIVPVKGDVTDSSNIEYTKSFSKAGTYNVTAECYNLLAPQAMTADTLFTIYFDCWEAGYFDSQFQNQSTPLTSKTNQDMTISASVLLTESCNGTVAHYWTYNTANGLKNETTLSAGVLNIPKYTMDPGLHKVELTTYFPDWDSSPTPPKLTDFVYARYTLPELVADIAVDKSENSVKKVWVKANVVVDSAASYDPASETSVDLTRTWECNRGVISDEAVYDFIGSDDFSAPPVNTDCSDILQADDTTFTIPADTLAVTDWYLLVLTLEHGATGRNAKKAQAIKATNGEPLDLEFKCQTNCHGGSTNTDLLTLEMLQINVAVNTPDVQNNTLSYTWMLQMLDPDSGLYVDKTNQIAENIGTGFKFLPEDMEKLGGQKYRVTCVVGAANYETTDVSQDYAMNLGPKDGSCELTGLSGPVVASIDELSFTCRDWTDEDIESGDHSTLKFAVVQVYLDETNGVNNSIPATVNTFQVQSATKCSQKFQLLKSPDERVNMTRVQVWVKDNVGPPITVVDLGDVEIKPAVANDASGEEGVTQVANVLASNQAKIDNAGKLNDLNQATSVVQVISNSLPKNTPKEEPIEPNPTAGGFFIGNNENNEPISSDDVFESLSKKKEDPTTTKCKEVTAELAAVVLKTSANQSPETKSDPAAQTALVQTVISLADQKTNLNNDTLNVLEEIITGIFNNTQDIEGGNSEYDVFIEGMVAMFEYAANSMQPDDLEGAEEGVSIADERKRSIAESIVAPDSVKELVETGELSEAETYFFKMRLAKKQKQDVAERKTRCNSYSSKKKEFQKKMVKNAKLSDRNVKNIGTDDSNVAITRATSEHMANTTLSSGKSSVQMPGLTEFGIEKVSLAVFEQKAVAHLDKNENAGGITSPETTIIVDSDREPSGRLKLTQKVEMVPKQKVELNVDKDDASQFTYFMVHVTRSYDDLNFNLEPDPDSAVAVESFNVYILYIDIIDAIDTMYVSKATYTANSEVKGPDWTTKFKPSQRGGEVTGIYRVGVEVVTAEDQSNEASRKKRSASNSTGSFNFATATMACMTWDDSDDTWRTDECEGTWKPDTGELECDCKPKKELTFANSFYVAPNKIDFSSVFLKFSPLNQAAVMATLLLIIIIYIIITIWARRQDRKDLLKWGITPLSDNFSEDNYFYVIKVFTGMRPGAGTRSRVCIVIAGEEMDTGVRELADGVREEFSTGSVMNFLMSTTVYLGDLDYIRIWHDNSGGGSNASWYLSRIEIHDVQRNESFTFLGERWLAVEKEDGLLECVLPVCKTENLNVFKNRFFVNAKDNLADSHIWISVAYRPQVSNFTRTQRASCALLFVMLTMISNAMFFRGSNDENYETPSELQVGPFRFSLQQIYISFVCALIVTPATLIVIYLFKLSKTRVDPNETLFKPNDKANRYKIPFMDSWLEKEQKRSMELERHLVQKGIPSSQGFSLPHWCARLAWFIVLATSFVCAFFIMLYSMQWGKQKSEEWITTFLLSFFESVFCLDPVKIGIMAIILALIFRSTKESQTPVNRSTIMKKYSTSLRGRSGGLRLPAPPLDEKKLEKARVERQRDLLMKKALRDIIVNILIIWVLFSISYSNRDVRSYYMHQEVVDRLLEPVNMPSFSKIKTTSDFFEWLNKTVIINAFPEYEKDANSTPLHWRVRQFIEGGSLFRVGPPRLRQLRTTKKSCTNSPFPTENCYKKYYEATEEKESYCIGWKDPPCDPDEEIYEYSSEAWRFTSALDIWGMPISGYYTTYGGGGYIAELSVNRQVSQVILNELFNNSWVDRQTRAVLFEFTLYCLNANIFTYNMFMVEFPETGAAFPYFVIFPMRVYLHQGPLGIYTLACEVIFVLYLIVLTVMVVIQMVQQKKAFFKQGWQVYELIFIILSYVAIVMNIVQVVFTNMSLDAFREDTKAFVNFYHLAIWNTVLVLLIGVLVFMATLRMLNILGYNKRIHAVALVFTKAASDLLWFGLFFSYVFTCYAAFGFLLFGWKLKSYKNIFTTMGTLFISMIGKSRFTEIEETDPIFSKIYFMCFIFFVVYMILTMFLAVLSKAIDQVHAETKTDKGDEVIEYFLKKMKGLMSYGGKTKKGTVKPAPWNRETSAWSRKRRAGAFNKATNREILQEIRESMYQALTDFSTPVSEHNKRQVKFRR